MKVGVTVCTRFDPPPSRTLALEVVRGGGAAGLADVQEVTRPGGLRIRVWHAPCCAQGLTSLPAGSVLRGAIAGVLACVGEVWLPGHLDCLLEALEVEADAAQRHSAPDEVGGGGLAGVLHHGLPGRGGLVQPPPGSL